MKVFQNDFELSLCSTLFLLKCSNGFWVWLGIWRDKSPKLTPYVYPPVCPQGRNWTGTISVFLLRVISFCFIKIFLAISYMFWIAKPIIICSVMECPEVSEPSFYCRIIITVTKDKIIWISHVVLFAGSVIKINLCLCTKTFWPGNEHNEYKMQEC